jgi:hypothetical protein
MFSVSGFCPKLIIRLVLVSYITQIFAPLYACEVVETLPVVNYHGKGMDSLGGNFEASSKHPHETETPSQKTAFGSEPSPNPASQAFRRQDLSNVDYAALYQYDLYQYRLEVQTFGLGSHSLALSRAHSDSPSQFETLYARKVQDSQRITTWDQDITPTHPLYGTFSQVSCSYGMNKEFEGYSWEIPGFGIVKVGRDGNVTYEQPSRDLSKFSAFRLILETSGDCKKSDELVIQSIQAKEVTLRSAKTTFKGDSTIGCLHNNREAVNEGILKVLIKLNNAGTLHNKGKGKILGAYHLHSDGEVINDAHLHVCKITGAGRLTNHSVVKMVGTEDKAAILSIREVVNKKEDRGDVKFIGKNLRITAENAVFDNGEGTDFQARRLGFGGPHSS